jgi:hypothetical protein
MSNNFWIKRMRKLSRVLTLAGKTAEPPPPSSDRCRKHDEGTQGLGGNEKRWARSARCCVCYRNWATELAVLPKEVFFGFIWGFKHYSLQRSFFSLAWVFPGRLRNDDNPYHQHSMGNFTFAVHPDVCRAHFFGRTTKRCFTVCFFQDTRRKNARQTHTLSCIFPWRTVNSHFAVHFSMGQTLPRVFALAHDKPLPPHRLVPPSRTVRFFVTFAMH